MKFGPGILRVRNMDLKFGCRDGRQKFNVLLTWSNPTWSTDVLYSLTASGSRSSGIFAACGAIHQLLNIILKLRILVLLPVSTLPYIVKVNNYS
jgi:hypothetical protein